jgi:hypothetical protein
MKPLIAVTAAWGLGLGMTLFGILPFRDYLATGSRPQARADGSEERPPVGLSALPQFLLPDVYGLTRHGSVRITSEVQPESSAAGYAGLIAALWLAPLAGSFPRHRPHTMFLCGLLIVSASWTLNIPGLITIWRTPGLNMLSYNRFVFATAFSVLGLATLGLETLKSPEFSPRAWLWIPLLTAVAFGGWWTYRLLAPPPELEARVAELIESFGPQPQPRERQLPSDIRSSFAMTYFGGVTRSLLALAGWTLLFRKQGSRYSVSGFAGAAMIGELLLFAQGRAMLSDPRWYYPRLPALARIAEREPGRILGLGCLPPQLSLTHGLRDVRGYDAVDPKLLLDILRLVQDPSVKSPRYAQTQNYIPLAAVRADGQVDYPPVIDMLNVRYLIGRGSPPSHLRVAIQAEDYWVLENPEALPRVFLPRQVRALPNDDAVLQQLVAQDFDPALSAFVTQPVPPLQNCQGSAQIVREHPQELVIQLEMQTPGLVVLSDLWYPEWTASLNGQPATILRTNHALRGVVVPQGKGELIFRYGATRFVRGLWLTGMSASLAIGWAIVAAIRNRRTIVNFS